MFSIDRGRGKHPFFGVNLQIHKKIFYASLILYEEAESEENKSKNVIFGGLPAFFVDRNLSKIWDL